jgi:hypothetical protein
LIKGAKSEILYDPKNMRITARDIGCYMDYLLCSLLVANPLRIDMYSKMKLGENLYKDHEGNWRIRFKPDDFKNFKGAAKDKYYDEPVAKWACPIIDDFLKFYRPLLIKGGKNEHNQYECDYFIRPIRASGISHRGADKYVPNMPIRKTTLSNRVRTATLRFLPETNSGFGPQAFRHIIATDYIKAHPNGFSAVAGILHDTLETVTKNYGHVNSGDWIRNYNDYTDGYFEDYSKNKNEVKNLRKQIFENIEREDLLKKENEKLKQEIDNIKKESKSDIHKMNEKLDQILNQQNSRS